MRGQLTHEVLKWLLMMLLLALVIMLVVLLYNRLPGLIRDLLNNVSIAL